MSIIIIHELGHFLVSKLYRWKTDKIYIYPLGGIIKLNEDINKSLKEELLIVLAGPLFQICYYHILLFLNIKNVSNFHYFLLAFNLLPVYPLDGGKILNILLSFFLPFKKSFNITIIISFIIYVAFLFTFVFFYNSVILLFVIFLIFFKIMDEFQKRKYYFNKFLLERHLKKYKFNKIKYINNIDKMYKERKHYFYIKGTVVSEEKYLHMYFKD